MQVFGLHCLPVTADTAAPVTRATLFFSRATLDTARATAEFVRSTIASTPSWSNHCRAMAAPTSGFSWKSAVSTSTFMSLPAVNS